MNLKEQDCYNANLNSGTKEKDTRVLRMKEILNFVKRYKWELLTFSTIFSILLLDCSPDMTWINTDSDGIHYTYAAKYLYPAHKTSAPLFLLLGHAFLWLPLGTEFWRIAFISVLASTASAVFIYLIITEKLGSKSVRPEEIEAQNNRSRIHGLIGALIFGGSALVISQSTIVETYALVTMFGLGAYYFAIKGKWLPCALMLGAGGAVHHLIGITLIVLFIAYKELRRWKYVGVMSAFLLFYLYIPITVAINHPIDIWGNLTLVTFMNDNLTTGGMLIGGLSIWDLPKRTLDTVGILGVSLGLALIPIGYFILERHNSSDPIRKKHYKEPLLWLFFLPIIYYCTNLAPQTVVYCMPAIGFGAVIAGIGLSRMRPYWKWVVLGCAAGLLAFNANYFDIGRNLDPELSASRYYYEELDKIPDNEVLVAQQGWEWAAVPMYNKENNRNILPVCTSTLPSKHYQQTLRDMGIKLDVPEVVRYEFSYEFSSDIAASILELNDNVWLTIPSAPRTYGAEIVPAKGNEELLGSTSHTILSTQEWQWRPSNPYDIITGAIEVEEWVQIVVSNYSCLMFGMLGVIGGISVWIGYMVFVRKRKWNLKRRAREPNLFRGAG